MFRHRFRAHGTVPKLPATKLRGHTRPRGRGGASHTCRILRCCEVITFSSWQSLLFFLSLFCSNAKNNGTDCAIYRFKGPFYPQDMLHFPCLLSILSSNVFVQFCMFFGLMPKMGSNCWLKLQKHAPWKQALVRKNALGGLWVLPYRYSMSWLETHSFSVSFTWNPTCSWGWPPK